MNSSIEVILKALVQHQVCAIARDAGSRFPNSNRVGRQAMLAIENVMQLQAMSNGTNINSIGDLTKMLSQPEATKDVTPKWARAISDRLDALEAHK